MNYQMMLRARPNPSQSIQEKHNRLREEFLRLPDFWRCSAKEWTEIPEIGVKPKQEFNLNRYLDKGVKGRICYQNRKYCPDKAMYDDYFLLDFNPLKVEYNSLVTQAFSGYINSFQPYRAHIGPIDFYAIDYEEERSFDQRNGVYRIFPANFFDRELCRRAFQSSPEEIAEKISDEVKQLSLQCDGMMVIADSKVLSLTEANEINERIKPLFVRRN